MARAARAPSMAVVVIVIAAAAGAVGCGGGTSGPPRDGKGGTGGASGAGAGGASASGAGGAPDGGAAGAVGSGVGGQSGAGGAGGVPDGGAAGAVGSGVGGQSGAGGGNNSAGSDGGTADSSAAGPPIQSADFWRESVKAACVFYTRCGVYPDTTTCQAVNPDDALEATFRADIVAGRILYDGARARICVDAYANQPCTISGEIAQSALPDPCAGVYTGTVAAGQLCYSLSECAGGAACVPATACTMACCSGTCVLPAARNGDCTTAPCPAGTYCRAQTKRCTTQSTIEGTLCDSSAGCAAPLFCIPDATGNGTCGRTLPSTSAPCDPAVGCDDVRDFCDAITNVCKRLVGVGQSCANDPNSCVLYAGCDGSLCQAFGTVGDACISDPTSGASTCLGSLVCTSPAMQCATPVATSCR